MNLFNDLSLCINPKLKEVITATSHQYLEEEENKMNEFIKKMSEKNESYRALDAFLDSELKAEYCVNYTIKSIYLYTQNPKAFNKNTADLILSSYLILYGISNLTIAKINEDNFTIHRVWLGLESISSLLLGSIALIMALFYNAEVLFLFIVVLILAACSNMVFAIKGRKPIVVGNDE